MLHEISVGVQNVHRNDLYSHWLGFDLAGLVVSVIMCGEWFG